MGLNLLLISLDANLAINEENASGNAKARCIDYAKYLNNLLIVVKTSKNISREVKKIRNNLFVYPTSSLNRYFFLYDAYNLASGICKENKIDLIVTQDPLVTGLIGWLLKKKYHIPLNIQIAADIIDNPYFIKESIFNIFLNRLAKQLLLRADSIRVSTLGEKEKLISQGIDKERIHYVPFFVHFLNFRQNEYSIRQLNLNGRFDKIVLSVGRLSKQKNIETLVRAIPYIIKKYPKCLFLIIGSGPEDKRLKRFASNLGVSENIKFKGKVCYKDISRYFLAADIFVITSHYEGTCMVIQEAAMAKKPIVSTPHAGAQETIKDGHTGFIVDFGDYIGLSQKILYLLENTNIARDIGNRAYDFIINHYKKKEILENYYDMYEQTISRCPVY